MITLKFGVFEDVADPAYVRDLELPRAHAPEPLLAYWRAALARLESHPALATPQLNPELLAQGFEPEPITIEVLLCSRKTLDEITETPRCLGVHLVTTPEGDPFLEESNSCRAYRMLVASDPAEFLRLTAELAEDDLYPDRYRDEYLRSYLNTLFHEVAHAVLFAENAALMVPADIESLSDAGEIDHDLFDTSTGYGIRPLLIDGELVWADTIDEASQMMEDFVEAQGHRFMGHALIGAEAPDRFPAAMGVADAFEQLLADPQEAPA